MKKFLLASSIFAGASFMAACSTQTPEHGGFPPMKPECKVVMEHMHKSHKQIEKLTKENKPTEIGDIIIADHKFMEGYPQCKPEHKMPPIPQNKDMPR